MIRFLSIILALALTAPLVAQVEPPKIEPPKPQPETAKKFKTVAPVATKAGDHIVLDASSAKGKIEFDYDAAVFPKERATLLGKILILSTSTNGTYKVSVISYEDGVTEKLTIKVTGGVEPSPGPKPEPIPSDPLEAFRLEMRTAMAKIDSRLSALEQKTPVPVPVPVPTPSDAIATAIHGAWQQEFAADKKEDAKKMIQCYLAARNKVDSASAWGELSTVIKNKSSELGINGKLPAVSKAINTQLLAAGFPASSSVLLAAGDADKAKTVFSKVITALETLP